MDLSEADPKGLVRESFCIEGITLPECRSIFLDWALSLKDADRVPEAIATLTATYGMNTGHPMLEVIAEALAHPAATGRRGGRAARMKYNEISGI